MLPIPLPTPLPLLLLPSTDCTQKRLCITLGSRFKVGESSSAPTARPTRDFKRDYGFIDTLDDEIRRDPKRDVGYGITDTWDEMVEAMQELPATDVAELSQRMTDFVMTINQDTNEIYGRLDDARDDRSLMSGQLNLLRRDRRAHARTTRLMKSEARLSREAWVQSMDASDTIRSEMAALQSQQTLARDPTHPDVLEEAGRVADVLAECKATKSGNGIDGHDLGMGGRRQAPLACECTYPDFMKYKPLHFKGTDDIK
ncbi:hypothetical protein Tco_0804741 [Tanacetum coccineum]|uniref:Uncharacterized protein n=1 Tax=Tanacetum coccineum TaxID=301880 RepID=A0ABQ5A9Q7_9ASTR